MFKVVLDTNIYVSALLNRKSSLFNLVNQGVKREYQILISSSIIQEIGRVLRKKFVLNDLEIKAALGFITKRALIVKSDITLNVIKHDPPDNRILECALASKAHLIVSGDSDLLRLKMFEGIPIIRPVDFLRILGEKY